MVPDLESERLLLTKLGTKHYSDEYLSWMNDIEVYRYLETGGDYKESQLRNFLEKAENDKDLHFWAIFRKDTGKHIGNIKLAPILKRHNRSGYGILMGDKASWGKGFAKEATLMLLDYAFNTLGIRKVGLGVVEDNVGALKLYESIGFKTEGRLKEQGIFDGKVCDSRWMAFFKKDFV